ncbi:MAG: hypothetical protein MJY88_06900, partial [Bacteroidales bacterium]|nr:hypothetical protein [Bacteroidales bacterium]
HSLMTNDVGCEDGQSPVAGGPSEDMGLPGRWRWQSVGGHGAARTVEMAVRLGTWGCQDGGAGGPSEGMG